MFYKVQTSDLLKKANNLSKQDQEYVANLVMIEVNTLSRQTSLSEDDYDNFVEERYNVFRKERKSISEAKGTYYIKSFLSELICYSHLKGDKNNVIKIMEWVENSKSNE